MWHLNQLPTEGTIVTYCQSGVRNLAAASALRRGQVRLVELNDRYVG